MGKDGRLDSPDCDSPDSNHRGPWEESVAERYRGAKSSLIYTTHPCGCSEIEGNGKVITCPQHMEVEDGR